MFLVVLFNYGQSTCNTNPLRDIYTSYNWRMFNSSTNSYLGLNPTKYEWANNNTMSKVSSFTSQASGQNNWCTEVLGTIDEFCCSFSDLNKIGYQLYSKYVIGTLSLLYSNIFVTNSDIKYNCQFQAFTIEQGVNLAQKISKALNGKYYAMAKWILAFAPLGQAEVCLICANDATISSKYAGSQLKVDKTNFQGMISNISKALIDLVAHQKNLVSELKQAYTKKIKTAQSEANCTDIMDLVIKYNQICDDEEACIKFITSSINTTMLEWQTFYDKASDVVFKEVPTRMLNSRLLATVPVDDGGITMSTYAGITTQLTIEGENFEKLKQLFSFMLQAVAVLLLAML